MKWLYATFLIFLGLSLAYSAPTEQDSTDSNEELVNAIKTAFEKKCQKLGGQEAANRLTTSLDAMVVCLEGYFPKNRDEIKLEDSSSSSEELCTDKRQEIRKCFEDVISALEDCSEPEEKYAPKFIFDSIDSVFDYLCGNSYENLNKILTMESLECFFSLLEVDNITDVCSDKLKMFNEEDESEDGPIITKEELCQDIKVAQECYGDFIANKCPGNTNFKEFVVGLYRAISSPCKDKKRDPLNPFNVGVIDVQANDLK